MLGRTLDTKEENAKSEHEIAVSVVVESVWFVPGWELTDVLVSQWRLLSFLEIALDAKPYLAIAYFSVISAWGALL